MITARGTGLSAQRWPPPLCPDIEAALGEAVRAARQEAASPPVSGADPKPRWTLRRLVGLVQERFARLYCRETIRAALHRLELSWKKGRKLLGRRSRAAGGLCRATPSAAGRGTEGPPSPGLSR